VLLFRVAFFSSPELGDNGGASSLPVGVAAAELGLDDESDLLLLLFTAAMLMPIVDDMFIAL
jgi:hypothetical protein